MRKINYSMEFLKILLSCMIVFIHIRFSGNFGYLMDVLARPGIVFFFAVAGFFSYNIDLIKIRKRISRLIKLLIIVSSIYCVETWVIYEQCNISILDYIMTTVNINALAYWIYMDANPFAGHLWFVSALIGSYLIYGLFVMLFTLEDANAAEDIFIKISVISDNRGGNKRCDRYRMIYIIGFCSMLFNILISIKSYAITEEVSNAYLVYRNTLFYGFPMFTMGLYIGENGLALKQYFSLTCKKLILVSLFFTILGLIQAYGIGATEVPIAMIVEVFLWLVFLCDDPVGTIFSGKFLMGRLFSDVSMFIYFMHVFIDNMMKVNIDVNVFGNLYPVLIVAICVVLGVVFSGVKSGILIFYKKE